MRDEDDSSRRPAAHVVGAPLDTLSVEEIDARIALLTREIERLRAAQAAKKTAREVAGSVFKF